MEWTLPFLSLMEQNWMGKKSKWNKPVHVRIVEVAAAAAVEEEEMAVADHMALVALDVEVDLDAEMIEEAAEEDAEVVAAELAITAKDKDIWRGTAPKSVKRAVDVEAVDLEAVEVEEVVEVETELATIATKRVTWQENAQKEIVEIVKYKVSRVLCD
jgi:hypothetical protein